MTAKCVRVTKRNRCPICGKPDWCLISEDGKAAICARIESNEIAGNKGAGWIHRLDTSSPLSPLPKSKQDARQTPKAAPDVLDRAYLALLAELRLSEAHRANLQCRGLTSMQIERLFYKTLTTSKRRELAMRLQAKDIRLAGVPGFYLDSGHWQLVGLDGIAIPVRDIKGRIIGIQVRLDQVGTLGRYRWLSSRGFNAGCSPGAPVHVAGPVSTNNEVWITEGPIKADIATMKLKCCVLAVAGVGNWTGVLPIISEIRPNRVIISFDMDKNQNAAVRLHLDILTTCLIKRGIRTFEADWDIHFRGLDDLLIESQSCQR